MNTTLYTSKPKDPDAGTTSYDIITGTMQIYVENDWHKIEHTSEQMPFFRWKTNTKLLTVDMMSSSWLFQNIQEIKKWLNVCNAGTYDQNCGTIIFTSQEMASFFQLKWG